jgi:hypothetical protein
VEWEYTVRPETAAEYERRTGGPPGPEALAGGRFRLTARFADHDIRYAATVSVEFEGTAAPSRAQAERLVWPAMEATAADALGDGDWRLSVIWLDAVELLADADAGAGPVPGPGPGELP